MREPATDLAAMAFPKPHQRELLHAMLSGLLELDKLAAARGDGLNPRLRDLLQSPQNACALGAVPLPVQTASAGLARQSATEQDLKAADIPRLHAPTEPMQIKTTSEVR